MLIYIYIFLRKHYIIPDFFSLGWPHRACFPIIFGHSFQMAVARVQPNQQELDSITLIEIGRRFKDDRPGMINWCRQQGLLATRMVCPSCNHHRCNEQNYAEKTDQIVWRCRNKRCKRPINIRFGSFFDKSHLELWQVLGLTYIWSSNPGRSRGMSQDYIRKELEIGGQHTVVDWLQFCRDVPVDYFLNNPVPIGGAGHVVEIDESLFARRKYNREI